jgi:hypothetical protein
MGFCRSRAGGIHPIENPEQKQAARERPAPVAGTYSGQMPRVKDNKAENGPKLKDLEGFQRSGAAGRDCCAALQPSGSLAVVIGNFKRARASHGG